MAYNKNKPMSDSSAMTSSFSKFLTMESKFFFYKVINIILNILGLSQNGNS